jgi:hypothetical protein
MQAAVEQATRITNESVTVDSDIMMEYSSSQGNSYVGYFDKIATSSF